MRFYINGTAMGTALAPSDANIVLFYIEQSCVQKSIYYIL
jgi:hypothetical protein